MDIPAKRVDNLFSLKQRRDKGFNKCPATKTKAGSCRPAFDMLYAEAAYTSFASMVISVLSSLEMGQFSFASSAISANLAASRPGTLAVTSR